jgi:hypothetical protein
MGSLTGNFMNSFASNLIGSLTSSFMGGYVFKL